MLAVSMISFTCGAPVSRPASASSIRIISRNCANTFLSEVLPRNEVCLAIHANALVGFIAASAESVAQLYVRVGCQRRGIGTQLLAWAKERSIGHLWLFTFARNLGARAFYERNGFVAIAHGFEPMWQLEDIKYQWKVGTHNAA